MEPCHFRHLSRFDATVANSAKDSSVVLNGDSSVNDIAGAPLWTDHGYFAHIRLNLTHQLKSSRSDLKSRDKERFGGFVYLILCQKDFDSCVMLNYMITHIFNTYVY